VTDPDLDVLAARQRVDEIARSRARMEAHAEAARANVDNVLADLAEEFWVRNSDDAKAMLAKLRAALDAQLVEFKRLLAEAEQAQP